MHKILLIISFLFGSHFMMAQHQISGKVTTADTNEALPGANVMVVGTTTGTVTEMDGSYRLSLKTLPVTLRFTFVGFTTQDITVTKSEEMAVKMEKRPLTKAELAEEKRRKAFYKGYLALDYIADAKNSLFQGIGIEHHIQSLGNKNTLSLSLSAAYWRNSDKQNGYAFQITKMLPYKHHVLLPDFISVSHSNFDYLADNKTQFNKTQVYLDFTRHIIHFDLGAAYYQTEEQTEGGTLEQKFIAPSIGLSTNFNYRKLNGLELSAEANLHPDGINYQIAADYAINIKRFRFSISAAYLNYFSQDYVMIGIRKTIFNTTYYCCFPKKSLMQMRY